MVSFRPGSSSSRALGGFSTVELRTATRVPPAWRRRRRRGGCSNRRIDQRRNRADRAAGRVLGDGRRSSRRSSCSRRRPARGSHRSGGTIGGCGCSRRPQGREPTGPRSARSASRAHATIEASLCRAIIILLARLNTRPTSRVGSQRQHRLQVGCRRLDRRVHDDRPIFLAFDSSLHAVWPTGRPPDFFSIFSQVRGRHSARSFVIPSNRPAPSGRRIRRAPDRGEDLGGRWSLAGYHSCAAWSGDVTGFRTAAWPRRRSRAQVRRPAGSGPARARAERAAVELKGATVHELRVSRVQNGIEPQATLASDLSYR